MHHIVICQNQRADACARQVQRGRRAQPTEADNQCARTLEALLTVNGDIFQQDLSAITHKITVIHCLLPPAPVAVPLRIASRPPG